MSDNKKTIPLLLPIKKGTDTVETKTKTDLQKSVRLYIKVK